ncbi:MAG: iron-containing alcohol dehydrogenase [Clostridiales Family XIII bacterium]|jgi:alcohol dehydrogenase YqhD (iron-dependent ADH family)|nr:iron-containing alcohol dehydrogenase [Clostridiales Family XIII bacterium]
MNNFQFQLQTSIVFGKGERDNIGKLLKPLAKKILFAHYGGEIVRMNGLYDTVTESLKNNGVEFVELPGVVPNPRVTLVREGIELCREHGVDLVLGVGGGSVIDTAKAVAAGVPYDGDVWDLFVDQKKLVKALPVATILTLPATGSESGGSSVVTNQDTKEKIVLANALLKPAVSILDPELFYSLPKKQIANGVFDMMSHIFERYFTNTKDTDLIDAMAEAALRVIMKHGRIVYAEPTNYESWCQVGFGGSLAHNDLFGIGRVQDWASHKIGNFLSGMYDVAHGASLAVLTPAWIQYVYKENPEMFVQWAVNVMGVQGSYRQPEELILEGIERLKSFIEELELPKNLAELGVPNKDDFEFIAKRLTGADQGEEVGIGGLKVLGWKDIVAILEIAWG